MPTTKEISTINYNGTNYIIVDSTAESKFAVLGHLHPVSEIPDLQFDSAGGGYNKTTNKAATVATVNEAIADIGLGSLGLDKALKFVGFIADNSQPITDGSVNIPTIDGVSGYSPSVGDVIIDNSNEYEYVYVKKDNGYF